MLLDKQTYRSYSLQDVHTSNKWLQSAIIALAISGIYSIILVLMRTPILTSLIGDSELKQHLFRTALIVHVDLSVLVWMLSIACYFWQLGTKPTIFHKCAAYLHVLGVVILSVSPLFPHTPSLNNYIPILDNLPFIIGLALIFCASIIMSGSALLLEKKLCLEKVTSSIIFLASIVSFMLSVPDAEMMLHGSILDRQDYYELLFWGPGHILQFLYVQLAMICWRALSNSSEYDDIYDFALIINCIAGVVGLYCHFLAPKDMSFILIKDFFTDHMKYFAGIAPSFAACLIIAKLYGVQAKERFNNLCFHALICSFILFFSGGLIALMIVGYDVTIPAHYHGSIVGVSIALMGFLYAILLDENELPCIKRAIQQLYLYMFGQMLHIIGLAISGGYGALRKTPGEDFPIHIKASMGLMGLGGLIAIIGGLMFVLICGKKLFTSQRMISN